MVRSDICIAGAGIIGLSLALELSSRGLGVIVTDSGRPMQEASSAAAGMLAADDPHNPVELFALSHFSVSVYPAFLARIQGLSGVDVPFQTHQTLQAIAGNTGPMLQPEIQVRLLRDGPAGKISGSHPGFVLLDEHSIDPRQLASALIAAVATTSIRTLYNSPVTATTATDGGVIVQTPSEAVEAAHFIDCTGAWANAHDPDSPCKALPIKGQMFAFELPPSLLLKTVLRTEDIYIVPRTLGPSAGRAIVGATVEDVGFDRTVEPCAIESLRRRAVELVPGLARANVVDSWSGLRPATRDRLPLLGAHPAKPNHWLATGHYRNGILLAPATARIMAQLILNEQPSINIDAFSPARFLARAAMSAL